MYTFEEHITNTLRPYFGMTQEQLKSHFHVYSNAKNLNEILLAKMLGIDGKISCTNEFQNANIVPKTVRVELDGSIQENMSFPTFRFTEIIKETWEDSELRNYLEPTKFLFVIFEQNTKGEYVFSRVKFWNIPADDLEEVRKVWERTVETIRNGVKLSFDGYATRNNLPKPSESRVAHVRPHGRNADDTYPLPDGREMTKQCFWFNNSYVKQIIREDD